MTQERATYGLGEARKDPILLAERPPAQRLCCAGAGLRSGAGPRRAGKGALFILAATAWMTIADTAAYAQNPTEGEPGELPVFHGLSYMTAFGPKNYGVVSLLYGVIVISLTVIAIIGGLVLIGSLWRGRLGNNPLELVRLERGGRGLWFIYVGMGLTFLALFATAIWNYFVLAAVAYPPKDTAATIHVVAHQWWWEIQYVSPDPSRDFTTANEIHIPVGQPVRFRLRGGDVIHSFWAPQLAGKMDAIPGQTNETWIEADKPGIYRGQCTEYCGLEHARMALLVVAETPAKFQSWWEHQLAAPPPPRGLAVVGQQDFQMHCASCHAVRGTEAEGALGPDLSHLMQRSTIASGVLPNDDSTLAHWIADPQSLKPGSLMPSPALSGQELMNVHAYLKTLD